MYIKHFGLKKLPFENVPDPEFFFDEGDHARARYRITESLKAGRGLTIVTGPIGSGKTTLSQMIISDIPAEIKLIWMAEPPETSTDLFLFIAQELGLSPSSNERVFVIRDIKDALLKINAEGRKCLMIIDESHLMTDDVINGIRLLNNLEEGSTKLIQILLLGQEEIMEIINRPEMEAFKQRIATLEIIGKMNAGRIREYISHRIEVAGGQPSICSETGWEALVLAFESGSTPRIINSLCDRSLNCAFEREKSSMDVDDVYNAAEGMGLGKEIFHYKISLRQREKQKPVPSNGENASVKEAEKPGNGPAPSLNKESGRADVQDSKRPSGTTQEARQTHEFTPFISEENRKDLKKPLLFLFISAAALILSIIFYCQRSGSSDCLLDLIGF